MIATGYAAYDRVTPPVVNGLAVKAVYVDLEQRIVELDDIVENDGLDEERRSALSNFRDGLRNAQVLVGRVLGIEA